MTIQEWFDSSGSFQDGVALYEQLPGCSNLLLRAFKTENLSNFISLKYELKRAINLGQKVSISEKPELSEIREIPVFPIIPENSDPVESGPSIEYFIQESEKVSFAKETMAMYPMELHPVYRERVSNFYMACELKFKLNALKPKQCDEALAIILQLEALWSKIDKAWMILEYWKDNGRLMPVEASKDYSTMTPMQLVNEKSLLEVRISKRKKTIDNLEIQLEQDPGNRVKSNQYNTKKEALEQLKIDLETIKKLLKNDETPLGST